MSDEAQEWSAGEVDAEGDVEAPDAMARQAHQQQPHAFQPAGHLQFANIERTQSEALDERSYSGLGRRYAATAMEARECAQSPVVVGGNSAGQAAVFLADSGSPATVVIRGPDLNATMSRYLVDSIEGHHRIELCANTKVIDLDGDDTLTSVQLSGVDGATSVTCAALFSFIGADPSSDWLSGCTALDERGFVLTDRSISDELLDNRWSLLGRRPLPFETSHPGLFAIGDIRAGSTKRVATAVGERSAAVRSVHEYLAFTH